MGHEAARQRSRIHLKARLCISRLPSWDNSAALYYPSANAVFQAPHRNLLTIPQYSDTMTCIRIHSIGVSPVQSDVISRGTI